MFNAYVHLLTELSVNVNNKKDTPNTRSLPFQIDKKNIKT